ncbi:MAG TPA: NUDIX domain-containing protein [Bacilli bacterium]|nr:NUDIX domain-containing protein [Bacilli bacterium]
MSHTFAGSYPGQHVTLTFNPSEFRDAGYVLVFAFHEGRLLLTRHRKRGWEIPGGTREQGEWPIQTAIREVYEETGGEVAALEPLGQYVITSPDQPIMVKTIYIAEIARLHPLPDGFETEEIRLLDDPPSPEQVRSDASYSRIMKDDVYRLTLQALQGHRLWNKRKHK